MMRVGFSFVVLLLSGAAQAQFTPPSLLAALPATSSGACAGYTGPGDVVSGATAWYGLRGYSCLYANPGTNVAVNIRNGTTAHTCDLLITSSGNLGNTVNCSTGGDNGQSAATFCVGATCYITQFYDQTGNGHHSVQASAGAQPALGFSCIGTSIGPCAQFSGGQKTVATISSLSQPYTFSSVAKSSADNGRVISAFNAGGAVIYHPAGGNYIGLYAGSALLSGPITPGTFYTAQGIGSGGASVIYINGTAFSGNAGTSVTATSLTLGDDAGGGSPLTGNIGEAGIWPAGFNSTQYAAMHSNQVAYWGI